MSALSNRIGSVAAWFITLALIAAPAIAQPGPGPGPGGPGGEGSGRVYGYGPGMMMGWGEGRYGYGHGALFAVVCLFALIGLIAIVMAATRFFSHDHRVARFGSSAGLEVLEARYARGEINREEYLEKKRDLRSR